MSIHQTWITSIHHVNSPVLNHVNSSCQFTSPESRQFIMSIHLSLNVYDTPTQILFPQLLHTTHCKHIQICHANERHTGWYIPPTNVIWRQPETCFKVSSVFAIMTLARARFLRQAFIPTDIRARVCVLYMCPLKRIQQHSAIHENANKINEHPSSDFHNKHIKK